MTRVVGSRFAWLFVTTSAEGTVSMPKRYPEEFRRKVLDLVAAGRPVAQIAADLGISDQTIFGWRKQNGSTPVNCPVSTALNRPSWPRPTNASANSRQR